MNLIVAVDKDWGIGKRNDLLVSIPEDMEYFREKTRDKVLVMGGATLDSLPGGRGLPKRKNIILSDNEDHKERENGRDEVFVRSLEELKEVIGREETDEVYLIGGGSMYSQLYKECRYAYVTEIEESYGAEVYCPNIKEDGWLVVETSEEKEYQGVKYRFVKYKNPDEKV